MGLVEQQGSAAVLEGGGQSPHSLMGLGGAAGVSSGVGGWRSVPHSLMDLVEQQGQQRCWRVEVRLPQSDGFGGAAGVSSGVGGWRSVSHSLMGLEEQQGSAAVLEGGGPSPTV